MITMPEFATTHIVTFTYWGFGAYVLIGGREARLELDQSVAHRNGDRLGARADAQLGIDALGVGGDGSV